MVSLGDAHSPALLVKPAVAANQLNAERDVPKPAESAEASGNGNGSGTSLPRSSPPGTSAISPNAGGAAVSQSVSMAPSF